MGEATAIAWTDHTFNPWWGCVAIEAPGDEPSECDNCYAETGARRYGWADGGGSGPLLWGPGTHRRTFGAGHWQEPRKWNRDAAAAGVRDLVFCGSYCDVFEARSDLDEHRARLWHTIEETPALVWQLLTKRPEQVRRKVPPGWLDAWPANVWIGTSVGTQRSAGLRIPRLLEVPAPVRFLSCEPLLTSVDLSRWWPRCNCLVPHLDGATQHDPGCSIFGRSIDWIIVGGESGPGHRPLDLDHARALVDQARRAAVPVFFKQVGGATSKAGGDLLDGERIHGFPAGMAYRHDTEVEIS